MYLLRRHCLRRWVFRFGLARSGLASYFNSNELCRQVQRVNREQRQPELRSNRSLFNCGAYYTGKSELIKKIRNNFL